MVSVSSRPRSAVDQLLETSFLISAFEIEVERQSYMPTMQVMPVADPKLAQTSPL